MRDLFDRHRDAPPRAGAPTVRLAGFVHREGEKALHFSDTGHARDAKWLPRAHAEIDAATRRVTADGLACEILCAEWLAKKEGLI